MKKRRFFPLLLLSLLFVSCAGQAGSYKILQKLQGAYRGIAEAALPSVVEITAFDGAPEAFAPWPYQDLFPSEEDYTPQSSGEGDIGIGSGVIIGLEGTTATILTNAHVLGEAEEIRVGFYYGAERKATILGKDNRRDIALLSASVDPTQVQVAEFGDSDAVRPGDLVVAVGTPFGLTSSVTSGIVSAMGREGPDDNISDFIQTDASINQGNSGGPLIDIQGRVVGINTWITTQTGGSIGLGFAIPSNNLQRPVAELLEFGEVRDGWLGIQVGWPIDAIAREMGLAGRAGAFVFHVMIDSPASQAGILPGDYITRLDRQTVENYAQVIRLISDIPAGDEIELELIRDKETIRLPLTVGRRPDDAELPALNRRFWPGFTVFTNEFYELEVARVEDQTVGQQNGLHRRDIITRINDIPLSTVREFYKIINDDTINDFTLEVKRKGGSITLHFPRVGVKND